MPILASLIAAAIWAACFYFPSAWTLTGIGEADKPFLDLQGLLAAGEVAQHGIDPYLNNPLDPYHRPHVYTEWWLFSGTLGLTRADTVWLGVLLLAITLASAALLLLPKNWREGRLLIMVLASPPLLMAISRANNDLVVFALMCGALACLRQTQPVPRALGVILLALSAVLKYFPLAAGLILLDARTRREFLGWCLLYGLVLVLAWPSLAHGLENAFKKAPSPEWLYAFGAPVLFRDFNLAAPVGWLLAGFLAMTAVASWPAIKAARTAPPEETATRDLQREYACGAVMVVGCFVHGSSYVYKMVFALWLLPWLWRAKLPATEARWWKVTHGLLVAVLWFEGSAAILINIGVFSALLLPLTANRMLEAALVISQLLTWALVACLWRALLIYTTRQLSNLVSPLQPAPLAAPEPHV